MKKLFIGNVPYGADDMDIAAFFRQHGIEATECTVVRDRQTGDARGFGFAQVAVEDYDRALDLSGTDMTIDGRTRQLTINEAQSKGRERSARR